ncbi:HAMP domain-containing sensor histidine kinase [Promicromonospora sp. MEB111]|uniref:sensor histidine kinase n=1 Tax=Promicromonospora sp. MEB111 TaxID=3040301 RepID=UPI0025512454|nr:HAMP domain-containing sensor histidine kinase [Promicromonospora sp. MEB111]
MPDVVAPTDRAPSTRRPTALRRRLVLVLAAVVLVVTAGLAVASTAVLRSQLLNQVDSELEQASQRLTQGPVQIRFRDAAPGDDASGTQPGQEIPALPMPAPGEASDTTRPAFPPGLGPGSAVVRYVDGEPVLADHVTTSLEREALDDDQVAELLDVPADGRPHDVRLDGLGAFRAVHVTTDDDEPLVVATSTATVDATVHGYVLVEVALGVAALLAAVGVGAWLVRRSLRPLDGVADAASRVSELELSRGAIDAIPRVPATLTDERTEVGQVGAALNRMLENVEVSLQARHDSETQVRSFVADASHELRTPLASIRGYAELVHRAPEELPPTAARSLDRIESEAVRMTGLVEDLLLLARLDAGRGLDRAPVDLVALAVDGVMDAHAASPGHAWKLELPSGADDDAHAGGDRADELVVTGDEASLRQVVANLLANARTHTPAGTQVRVRLLREGDAVVLHVTDDGPGIPAGLRPSLFHRFTRGDVARNRNGGSTGLGLSIADAIVTEHGGSIAVRSRTADEGPATGTTFTVRLPHRMR